MSVDVRALIILTASGGTSNVVLSDESDDGATQHAEFALVDRCARLALFGTDVVVEADSDSEADCRAAAEDVVAARLGTDWIVRDLVAADYTNPRSRWNGANQTWDPPASGDVQHAWRLGYKEAGDYVVMTSSDLSSSGGLASQSNLVARIMIQYPA